MLMWVILISRFARNGPSGPAISYCTDDAHTIFCRKRPVGILHTTRQGTPAVNVRLAYEARVCSPPNFVIFMAYLGKYAHFLASYTHVHVNFAFLTFFGAGFPEFIFHMPSDLNLLAFL